MVNKILLTKILFLLASCVSPNGVFNHGIGYKGEKINGSYLFSKGKGSATRLFVITDEGADIREGSIKFSSSEQESTIKILQENKGAHWHENGLWGAWVKDEHLVGREVYVIFLRDALIDFPEENPILMIDKVFPSNSDFYLWGMPKWSVKKIE